MNPILRSTIAAILLTGTPLLPNEPPEVSSKYEIQLDGRKSVVGSSGGKVKIGGKPYDISIRQLETMTFDDGIVSFDLPSELSRKKELDEGTSVWTFSRNVAHLIIFRPGKAESKSFADAYSDALMQHYESEGGARKSEIKQRFGDKDVPGVRVEAKMTEDILQDVFRIEVGGQWYVFLIQDDKEDPSSEMKQTRELLRRTFRASSRDPAAKK